MSTVDYTRYTRIIHCRPCYNVYVKSVLQRKGCIEDILQVRKNYAQKNNMFLKFPKQETMYWGGRNSILRTLSRKKAFTRYVVVRNSILRASCVETIACSKRFHTVWTTCIRHFIGRNDIWRAHCEDEMSCYGTFLRQETICLGCVAANKNILNVRYRENYMMMTFCKE